MRVEVVSALPGGQQVRRITLADGATVRDALRAAGMPEDLPAGIFGRVVAPGTLLRDGDRVELYRPLAADPKAMRRRRAALKQRRR
jgi:hypothetical protein